MIQMWTVRYLDPTTGVREGITIYAYPSGGVGMTVTAEDLGKAIAGPHELIGGIPAGHAEALAIRLVDMIATLTGGDIDDYQLAEESDRQERQGSS